MRKVNIFILFALLGLSFVAGCNKMEDDFAYNDIVRNGMIAPYCMFESNSESRYVADRMATKSLINTTTSVDTILCNFLRIEESGSSFSASNPDYTTNYTTNWLEAYLSEGTIATVPNSTGGGLRSVSLKPEQPYNTTAQNIRSRMVGWYPRTNEVPETPTGNDVSIKFKNFNTTVNTWEDSEGNYIGVKFSGLDGSKDIMVSDVRDGSVSLPFGGTDNFFTFKHYLSAIRVYAKAERSSQDIGMWGKISEVVIMNQPTSCTVALPQNPKSDVTPISDGFSSVVKWGDENAKLKIQKGYIFGEKDAGKANNTVAEEYPIELSGSGIEKYLGYSLIKPNTELRIQIHTLSGVYDVHLPALYGDDNTPVFNPGCIYNLHLDFKTDGTIFAFLENEGNEKYFDLTKGEARQFDSNGDGNVDEDDDHIYGNKYANCYIVYSTPTGTDQYPDGDGAKTSYDGFCFDATVVGNGEGGIISTGAQTFYPTDVHIHPYSADILWETSPRLISQVELIYGFVRFKVAKERNNDGTFKNFKKGNAVIAVYDKEKRILWSWHIWITDKPADIAYTESSTEGSTTITLLDRNLGATFGGVPGSDAEALASYGLYYQWGRKDPSMGPPAWDYSPINMTTAPYYDYSSDEKTAAEVVRFAQPTLKDAVENPMYLIMPTSYTQTYYFNWLYEKIDFLWGNSITSGNTHKTIYDPCPYGYRVSGGELADLFGYATILGHDSFTTYAYGQTVTVPEKSTAPNGAKSVFFFPYAGYKGVDRGLNSLVCSWRYVGQKGDYQSAIVARNPQDQDYYMHRTRIYISKERTWDELNVGSYTGHQIEDYTNRRSAAPVRCVKNVDMQRVMAYITPSQYTITENQSTPVTFTLFAETFESDLASAKLYVAYHKKNDNGTEGDHVEVEIEKWEQLSGKQWSLSYSYTFPNALIAQSTGSFRFVLHVKSKKNVNKISSTTIRVANNGYDFTNWKQQDSTVLIGEPIERKIRIYGESKCTKVLMFGVNPSSIVSAPIDITNYTSPAGSEGVQDLYYSTNNLLKFGTKGWNSVYFKITFENGENITTEKRWFKVCGVAKENTPLTSVGSISQNKYYIIENVEHREHYLYDNGGAMRASTTIDATKMFKFIPQSDNEFKIQNVHTGDYVKGNNININEQDINNATQYTVEYSNSYANFTISINNSNYWRLQYSNWDVTSRNYINDQTRWRIYEVTKDDNGISETPLSQSSN